jgi:hypothetical protein
MVNLQGILNTNYMVVDSLTNKMNDVQSEIDSLLKQHTKENYIKYIFYRSPKGMVEAEKEIAGLKTHVDQMLELSKKIESIWDRIEKIAAKVYGDKNNIN